MLPQLEASCRVSACRPVQQGGNAEEVMGQASTTNQSQPRNSKKQRIAPCPKDIPLLPSFDQSPARLLCSNLCLSFTDLHLCVQICQNSSQFFNRDFKSQQGLGQCNTSCETPHISAQVSVHSKTLCYSRRRKKTFHDKSRVSWLHRRYWKEPLGLKKINKHIQELTVKK